MTSIIDADKSSRALTSVYYQGGASSGNNYAASPKQARQLQQAPTSGAKRRRARGGGARSPKSQRGHGFECYYCHRTDGHQTFECSHTTTDVSGNPIMPRKPAQPTAQAPQVRRLGGREGARKMYEEGLVDALEDKRRR